MKIKSQNNINQGDVYNIEKIEASKHDGFQNLNLHLVKESVVSGKSIDSCKAEIMIIFLLGMIGLFADISELFPSFKVPWWLWALGFICAFPYIVIKYGDAFGVSRNEKIQISEPGKILLASGNDFNKNRS